MSLLGKFGHSNRYIKRLHENKSSFYHLLLLIFQIIELIYKIDTHSIENGYIFKIKRMKMNLKKTKVGVKRFLYYIYSFKMCHQIVI